MATAVELLRELASTLKTAHGEPNDISIESKDEIIRKLQRDFEGSTRAETLRGLCDMLQSDLRPAVAKVLDSVSWEVMGLLLESLDQSQPSSPSSLNGSDIDPESPFPVSVDDRGSSTRVSKEATLPERLVLEMAEIFSPKELHIIALEHLHAYSGERTVRAILTVLRRSTERMPLVQRAKFLEAAMQPALRATRQMAKERAAANGGKSPLDRNDSPEKLYDESQNESRRGKNSASAATGERQPLLMEEEELPSYEACEAAAVAVNAAVDFVGPLLEQASAERVRDHNEEADVPAADRAGPTAGTTVNGVAGILAASDRSLVAYLGFALAALEEASETSACVASSAAAAAAHDSSSAPGGGALPATVLARAEERMVALVMGAPAIDLRFILLHGCRLSYANRIERRQSESEGVEEETEHVKQTAPRRGSARLGELALSGAMPWTLRGVSCFAHLVACRPEVRDRWLPLVWSRGTERRLFLPHAQELMRARSKRVASKGLELTCFVAERLGRHPDEAGAFPLEWQPAEETNDGASNHRDRDDDRAFEDREVVDGAASKGTRCWRLRRRRYFKPFYLDLADFLQVLIDVMVSCAVPSLRARGHSAVSAFLSAADEVSRFRVLKRLIERCPWPNATGLLLDTFRREMDRAFRCTSNPPSPAGGIKKKSCSACYGAQEHPRSLLGNSDRNKLDRAASVDAGPPSTGVDAPGGKPRETAGRIASPFASAQAGKFVREQLRRACRKGPSMSLLMDMDSRTGGLALARYAHALDRVGGSGSSSGRGRGGCAGQLELRRPDVLRDTMLLVQGFLDDLQGATFTIKGAGPEYFRLFILEDACQQCLQELQR